MGSEGWKTPQDTSFWSGLTGNGFLKYVTLREKKCFVSLQVAEILGRVRIGWFPERVTLQAVIHQGLPRVNE